MLSSKDSRFLFRVFAIYMVLSGTSTSNIGVSAVLTKAAVTSWVKAAKHGYEALIAQRRV